LRHPNTWLALTPCDSATRATDAPSTITQSIKPRLEFVEEQYGWLRFKHLKEQPAHWFLCIHRRLSARKRSSYDLRFDQRQGLGLYSGIGHCRHVSIWGK
jgi:hypothetical protein